jgi:hypothetical protein
MAPIADVTAAIDKLLPSDRPAGTGSAQKKSEELNT